MNFHGWAKAVLGIACVIFTWSSGNSRAEAANLRGKEIYNYYCYQCHGYSGDAQTLASTYLDPGPRNFTAADPIRLSMEIMVDAVSHGRPGTAMVGFESILSSEDIRAVGGYIRQSFMGKTRTRARYHTAENGWDRHDRYQAAYPFVNKEIPLDTPWEDLTDAGRRGKQLYLKTCVSCHDHGPVPDQGPIWELYTVTYPHHEEEAHGGEDLKVDNGGEYAKYFPYSVHRETPVETSLTGAEHRGRNLYRDNCAFCHAGDGTGRNWIGSFLQPRPTNLSRPRTPAMSETRMHALIKRGIPGTSMPAWGQVLADGQISDIVVYIANVLSASGPDWAQQMDSKSPSATAAIGWTRRHPVSGEGQTVQ